ncbi:MAG: glycosyltransferase family 4 protein, partial [Demequinaceae bacterium]|nr:glycosyltransferase family 4 protein [Demequinaceae bacterium]
MRIVVVTRIFSPEPSAASFVLKAIAIQFREAGHQVTVVTTRPPKGMKIPGIPGVRVKRARVLRDSRGYVRGYLPYLSFDVPLFFRLLFSRRADLYFVEPPPTTGVVVRMVAWLFRRPYVYRAADIWSDAAQVATSSRLVVSLLRRAERFAIRGASHAFANTNGLIERLRELDIDTPATAIGVGVDTEVFRFIPVTDPPPTRYFVYAGTYSEWQGAGIFVEAFARFSTSHQGFRLVFVGNGSERGALESKRDELGLDSIEFRDPAPAGEVNVLLAYATASLVSLKPGEGYDYAFPTKVYASIAAGCPVVFSGVGPTADFIHETSSVQPIGAAVPYDVEVITAALVEIADNPLPPQSRSQLSAWAHDRFSLTSVADIVVTVSIDLVK